jgi:transposase InsO family protein
MAFVERSRLEQRVAMLADYDTGLFTVSALCAAYGVSRETFYVWRARRAHGAPDWFCDRSHAPAACPHRTPEPLAQAVLAVRRRFPHFGPKKIKAVLAREQPAIAWPAPSTIGGLLARAGLVAPPPRRRRRPEAGLADTAPALGAHDEWACDFKGWFRTRDGVRCDPLTLTDRASRFLIAVRIVPPSAKGVRPVFEAAFREHGLPRAIRCDNGPPFGGAGPAGLTQLSVWWLRLGIEPRFIRPGTPGDNACHERLHRTLKDQTACPPAQSAGEQQARFAAFCAHYNGERPHEALDQDRPADRFDPSPRLYPKTLPEPWYDADHQVRRVRPTGEIKWAGRRVFLGEALGGELVGLAEADEGRWVVRFCGVTLGGLDRDGRFRRLAPLRHRLHPATPPNLSGINPV